MAVSRWKAKTEAWRHNELLKMKREELDLQRELFVKKTGHEPKTRPATRDDIHTYLADS